MHTGPHLNETSTLTILIKANRIIPAIVSVLIFTKMPEREILRTTICLIQPAAAAAAAAAGLRVCACAERLTCDRQPGGAAGDGAQVLDGGHALVGALVGLVVLGVDHVGEEQRAVGEDAPALVRQQAHEGAVLLPLHPRRRGRVAVGRAVEQRRASPEHQRVPGLRREPEGAEGLRC